MMTVRGAGVACASTATGLGLVYMAAAGAPEIYLAVNGLTLLMGLALIAVMKSTQQPPRLSGGVGVVLGWLLLATALFGASVEGASRWISVGGLSLQVSLIVLPAMLVGLAQRRDHLATIAAILAAVAFALQPDRAMAGVLVAALIVLAVCRRDRQVASMVLVAVVCFTVTLIRPDGLPAVPYVDQILYTAFQVHPLAGIAVVSGALLLVVPAIMGLKVDPMNREVYAVFGAVWLSIVAAAAIGNYPTPLVGYGGSAILGYALSLSFLPMGVRSARVAELSERTAREDRQEDPDLRVGAGYPKRPEEYLRQFQV